MGTQGQGRLWGQEIDSGDGAAGIRGDIALGTSSWSHRGWVGPFYPTGTRPAGFLGYYSRRFPVVEADVTYYRIPSHEMISGWVEGTPSGFRIAAKFPRSVVHAGSGPLPDARKLLTAEAGGRDLDGFLEAMEGLGARVGPLLIQLPRFSVRDFREPGPLLERLAYFLQRLPSTFRYAVEVRNTDWIQEPLLRILKEFRSALVLAEFPGMDRPWTRGLGEELLTTDTCYVRLVGDRRAIEAKTTVFDQEVLESQNLVEQWADWIVQMASSERDVLVFANNHFAGHGPATVRRLAAALADRGGAVRRPSGGAS